MLQLQEFKNENNRIKFVNLTALRALLISAYDVDHTHHKIIQEPKQTLCRIHQDQIFVGNTLFIKKGAGTLQ